MRVEREHWPLTWTVTPRPGESLVTIFDLVELRSTVDTLRVAADLPPAAWSGRTDEDPTFEAGRTPIRAIHFNQLREAIGELFEAAELEPPAEFSGGPVVARTRAIKLSDTLDLRGWVEGYEAQRPELAARVVRKFGAYSVPGLVVEERAQDRLTEMWDGAGFSRYFYDGAGRLSRELRVLDSHEYWTAYEYDDQGRLSALTYPDGERAGSRQLSAISSRQPSAVSRQEPVDGEVVGPPQTGVQALAEAWERTGESAVRYDGLGRPVALGNPARPFLRLAYDGDGRLVKRLDDRGTVHFVGDHYERNVGVGDEPDEVTKYVVDPAGGRWRLGRVGSRQWAVGSPPAPPRRASPPTPSPGLPHPRPSADGHPPSPHGGEGVGGEARWLGSKDGLGAGRRTTDALWQKVGPLLPQAKTGPNGETDAGNRQVFDAILYALRTGTPWPALPPEWGSPGVVHRRFVEWQAAGVLGQLGRLGLPGLEVFWGW